MNNNLEIMLQQATRPSTDILKRIHDFITKIHVMTDNELIILYQSLNVLKQTQPKGFFFKKTKIQKGIESLQNVIEQSMSKRIIEAGSADFAEGFMAGLNNKLTKQESRLRNFEMVIGKKILK